MSITPPPRFPTLLVTVLGTGVLLSSLDAFITFAATPSIEAGLHASDASAQLFIGSYLVVLASFVVTGARLGERLGLLRAYRLGMVVFALASLACALAPSAAALLAGRLAQGAGAAIMSPQGLAGIRRFVGDAHRAQATGRLGLLGGIGATAGQVVGGALVTLDLAGSSWRACFLVNLPIAAVAFVAAGRVIPRDPPTPVRFDPLGIALSALGLGALVVGATQGRQQGWPAWAFVALGGGAVLLAIFARHEATLERRGGRPLVSAALLRAPGFARAALAVGLLFTTAAGFYLPVALLLQQGLGLGPLAAGLVFVPFGAGFYLGSGHSHRVAGRPLTPVAVMLAGIAVLGALLASVGTGAPVAAVGAAGALVGLGQGALMGLLMGTAVGHAPLELAGQAGGVIATLQQAGNSLGVAVVGGALFAVAGPHAGPHATVDGFLAALAVVAVAVIGLGLLAWQPSRARRRATARPSAAVAGQ